MATEHTFQNTTKPVSLTFGLVDLIDEKNPRKRTRAAFTDVLVAGETDDEIRKNFRYEKAFRWEHRGPIREKQRKGLIELVEIQKTRTLGLLSSDVVPVDDQLI